ncbi:MAG: polysaccharide deacetylase family protein [Clostridiales bacterium]|nr:polysaccharide deacetylase family protein [Clostridiales bacterium]
MTRHKKVEGKRPIRICLLVVGMVLLLLLAGNFSGFFHIPTVIGQERKLPIYSVGTEEKKVAISFDAAWGNSHTGPILDILDQYGIKTTFFLVKFWADKYPEDVKEISRRGHEVQNHSATHPDMTTLSVEQIREEIESAGAAIEALTGIRPNLFRPPFGAYNNRVIETLEEMGYKVIQWSVDSLDWKEISADQIVQRVLSRIEPGAIVLFHNDAVYVEEYLPRILDALVAQGYEVVPISQLIFWENYHIDHTGKQIAN